MRQKLISILIVMTLAALLLACGTRPGPTPADGQTGGASTALEGTEWTLLSLNGERPIAGTELTLEFHSGNEIDGSAGCNSFGGTYAVDGNSLTITELYHTEMACTEPDGVMEQEQTYVELLRQTAGYTVTDDELTLVNDAGDTILTFTR